MLIQFKWLCKVITLLLASGKLEFDDLDSVMVPANHYYSKDFSPQRAFELISMAWPDTHYHNEHAEEPEDTFEEALLSWCEENLLPPGGFDN